MSDEQIIEIGEPTFDEVVIQDADIVQGAAAGERETTNLSSKYSSETLGNTFVMAMSAGCSYASKLTGKDLDLTEPEAQELHTAMVDFGNSFGGVDLPPWATLLLVTGTVVGGRYMAATLPEEKEVKQNA